MNLWLRDELSSSGAFTSGVRASKPPCETSGLAFGRVRCDCLIVRCLDLNPRRQTGRGFSRFLVMDC